MQKYSMEALGTFFLTLIVCFTSLAINPIVVGLILMSLIYIGAHISGAHYNPAISLAFFMRNRLKLEELIKYVAAQVVGALCALGVFFQMTGITFFPEMKEEAEMLVYDMITSMSIEGLMTFVFCLTALTVFMVDKYKGQGNQGLIIGLTFMAISFLGGIYNPAIAISAVFVNAMSSSFSGMWPVLIHIVGPLVGGAAAAVAFGALNDK